MFDPYNSRAYVRLRKKIYNFYVYPHFHNVEYLNKTLAFMRRLITQGRLDEWQFRLVKAELEMAYKRIGDDINKH